MPVQKRESPAQGSRDAAGRRYRVSHSEPASRSKRGSNTKTSKTHDHDDDEEANAKSMSNKLWKPAWLTVFLLALEVMVVLIVTYATPAEGVLGSSVLVVGNAQFGLLRACADSVCDPWMSANGTVSTTAGLSVIGSSTSTALIASNWLLVYLFLLIILRRFTSAPSLEEPEEPKDKEPSSGECCGCECMWCILPFVWVWKLAKRTLKWVKLRAVYMCKTLVLVSLITTIAVAMKATWVANAERASGAGGFGNGIVLLHVVWVGLLYIAIREYFPKVNLYPKWCPSWPSYCPSPGCTTCKSCYPSCLSCGGGPDSPQGSKKTFDRAPH